MLSESLMGTLSTMKPDLVTDIFCFIIIGYFLYAFYKRNTEKIRASAPTILTTVGVLGTFLGITIGLANFDFSTHKTIEASIPSLLSGLKMAFLTSILGIFASIIMRIVIERAKYKDQEGPEEVSSQDIYNLLREQCDSMNGVRAVISGDQDASLITQIQKMRNDMNDGIRSIERSIAGDSEDSISNKLTSINSNLSKSTDEIKAEFRDFSSKLSEMATQHIIEALKEVIRNFNENLNEQFGDNFKQLNQAVEKLVTWQEEYRQQMIDTKAALDSSVEAMSSGAESLESIRNDAQAIPPTMKTLEEVLEVLGTELTDLQESIESFGQIKDKAEEALPAISKNIEEITGMVNQTVEEGSNLHKKFVDETIDLVDWVTTYLKDTANDISDKNKQMSDIMTQAAEDVQKSVNSVQEQSKEVVEDLGNSFKESTSKINDQIREVLESQAQEVNKLSESLRQEMQKANKEREESLNQEINEIAKKMDEALQQEMQRALQGMADHLGAISKKFIDDYSVLTDRMKEVVNQAKRFE